MCLVPACSRLLYSVDEVVVLKILKVLKERAEKKVEKEGKEGKVEGDRKRLQIQQ